MPRTLAGQVAIVTGASSGIGAATAQELARRGAQVMRTVRTIARASSSSILLEVLARRPEAIVSVPVFRVASP